MTSLGVWLAVCIVCWLIHLLTHIFGRLFRTYSLLELRQQTRFDAQIAGPGQSSGEGYRTRGPPRLTLLRLSPFSAVLRKNSSDLSVEKKNLPDRRLVVHFSKTNPFTALKF